MNIILCLRLFIYALFNGGVSSSDYTHHLLGLLVNNELKNLRGGYSGLV